MGKTIIEGVAGLRALVGKEMGRSDWRTLRFEDIVKFADATGDHQWIHVDRQRIARESPFGKPIAHGYFSVAVIAGLYFEMIETRGLNLAINYGINRVRFPAPLKEGARYRLVGTLLDVKEVANGNEAAMHFVIEIEGSAKPACVAECIFRFYH